jgi:two-component system sensor histidine kinase TorS
LPLLDDAYLAGEIDGLGCAMLLELLVLFRKDADVAFTEFQRGVETSDRPSLAKRAHRLRSAAGNLGFTRVMAESRKLEDAATDATADMAGIVLIIDRLRESCDLSGAALEAALAGAERARRGTPPSPMPD